MLSGEHLLIVEEESLIAYDIQRIVATAHAEKTVFARNFREAQALGEGLRRLDLAIINPPRRPSDWGIAERLASSQAAIVVCTATNVQLEGTALADAEIVYKPFSDADMLAACGRALERRGRIS